MKFEVALAAVALRTAIKYRKGWNKNSPTVKLLQSMMPTIANQKKGYRYYMPIGSKTAQRHYKIPPAVFYAVKRAGYTITDYLAKKCVKTSDKEQKNEFNIGKVIAKDAIAKATFDNDPQLQNSNAAQHLMVVSCHPYDVIGMSTGRDWDKQSCMRLDDGRSNINDRGLHVRSLINDVAEGTMVAYAIREDDINITKPLVRCLIKPFWNEDSEDILMRRETRLYGNNVPGFSTTLNKFLRNINAKASNGTYEMAVGLYNDGIEGRVEYEGDGGGRITTDDLRVGTEETWDQLRKAGAREMLELFTDIAGEENNGKPLPDTVWEHLHQVITQSKAALAAAQSMRNLRQLSRYFDGPVVDFDKLDEIEKSHPAADVKGTVRKQTFNDLLAAAENDPRAAKFLWEDFHGDSRLLDALLRGIVRAPTHEELLAFPDMAKALISYAKVLRHLRIYGVATYDQFSHELLHNAHGIEVEHEEGTDIKSALRHSVTDEVYAYLPVCIALEEPYFTGVPRSSPDIWFTRPALKSLQRAGANLFLQKAFYLYMVTYATNWNNGDVRFEKTVLNETVKYFEENPGDIPTVLSHAPLLMANLSMKLLMQVDDFDTASMFRVVKLMLQYTGEQQTPETKEAWKYTSIAAALAEQLGIVFKFDFKTKAFGPALLDDNSMMMFSLRKEFPGIDVYKLGLGQFAIEYGEIETTCENIERLPYFSLREIIKPYNEIIKKLHNALPYSFDISVPQIEKYQRRVATAGLSAAKFMLDKVLHGVTGTFEEEYEEFAEHDDHPQRALDSLEEKLKDLILEIEGLLQT